MNISGKALRRMALSGAVVLALLANHPACAEAADGPNRDSGIVVTATRSGQGIPQDRLGASATIVDAQEMEQRQTRLLADVLRDVPGVAVSRAGGAGGLTQIRLRGAEGNHVLVLVDGIEAADPYSGEFDFGTLLADPGTRVEVLRGQQSALYGSDAIGGVVHYMTLSGAEAPGALVRLEGGSFDTVTGGARLAGLSGDLDYAFTGSFYHTGGSPTARNGQRNVGADLASLASKLTWQPDERLRLTAVARYSYAAAESNNSENDPASPLFGQVVDSPGTHYRNRAFYGLVSAEFSGLEGRWTNTVTGQIADAHRRSYSDSLFDGGDQGQRLKGSFVSSLRFGSDAVAQSLSAAVDVERESFRNTTPFSFQGRRHTDNLGLVGQYIAIIKDALTLGASIRRDENDRFADTTTYRLQGSYAFPTHTRLHAAWGTGVKNPGYFELFGYSDGRYIGNPNLRPEKSKGWEAGVAQDFASATATIGVTYFDNRLHDEIYTTYPAPDFVATPANRSTQSTQRGVEAYATAHPSPQLSLSAAYTYLRAREDGVEEVRRPRHIASVNASWATTDERFASTLTVRYNGRQVDLAYTDPSYVPVRETLDDFVLVNLNAEFRLRPGIVLTGRVENLLDQDYEEVFSYRAPGLSALGGLRLTL